MGCRATVAFYDVCGRIRVQVARDRAGRRRVEQVGSDGKWRVLVDVLIPDDYGEDKIPAFPEAAFHEMGRPGEVIRRLD